MRLLPVVCCLVLLQGSTSLPNLAKLKAAKLDQQLLEGGITGGSLPKDKSVRHGNLKENDDPTKFVDTNNIKVYNNTLSSEKDYSDVSNGFPNSYKNKNHLRRKREAVTVRINGNITTYKYESPRDWIVLTSILIKMKVLSRFYRCVFGRKDFKGTRARYSTTTDSKLAFVGLGNMGEKMCRNLLKKNHKVIVKDLSPKREALLERDGAIVAKENAEIAEFADFIITMLPASQHVTSFYAGETGILKSIRPGTIAIDCSTIDHGTPKHLGNLFEQCGAFIIDAPVSGGVPAATNGTLTFMVGGEKEIIEKAKPILSDMGKNIIYCGDLGAGQIAKICNNLLLAITMFGAAETFHLGQKLGIDLKILSSVLNTSSGRCWVTDTYNPVPNILENVPSSKGYEAGFTSQMLLKDLKIAERTSRQISHPFHMGKVALEMYEQICNTDLREKDFSVIYDYLTKKSYYDKLKE